jgi:hypothetical protein
MRFSYYRVALKLKPEQPVIVHVEFRSTIHPLFSTHELNDLLAALSKTRAQVTSLKMLVPDHLYSLLPALASTCQHLEHLTIKFCHTPEHCSRTHASDHLLRQSFCTPPGAMAAVLFNLKSVEIWAEHDYPFLFIYERLLKEKFVPICPALVLFECVCTLLPFSFELDEPPEPRQAWKARRLSGGNWEQQGPPPIPLETLSVET